MAAQFAVDILFKALGTDKLRQATAEANKVEKAAEQLNGKLRDTQGRFIKAGQGAEQAANGIKRFGLAAGAAKAANDKLNDALSFTALKLAAVGAAVKYFQGFKEADRAAAAVRTLGVDAKALEQQLLNVSNRMGGLYSQTQLMTSAYDVASAGFMNVADNAKVLEAAAKGAVGGMADINEVANATTSVLNAYGKSAGEAGKLVDGFIQTQNDGKIVVAEYAQYIGKLAPVGRAAGISIEELNAAISTATAQGLPVEATFTGLAQAITSILKPSKEASDLAAALGIGFNEAALKSKGFGGVLADVKAKTGNSATAMTQLFGSVEAVKAILPLTNDDLVKFNKNLTNQANAAGVADKAVAEMGGTVSSEITKMMNKVGNLARLLDTVLAPIFGNLIKLINLVITEATKGINVLSQLFSMSPNTTILKQALESGDLRGNNAGRVVAGADQLIGSKRRQELQRQAGAGTGFFGLGFDAKKFGELLKKEPAIQKLLGGGGTPAASAPLVQPIDPKVQATLDALNSDEEKKKGKSQKKLADEQEKIDKELAQNRIDLDNQVFKNQQDLIKQRYDLESELAEKMAGIWANGFQGAAREQANLINELIKSGEEFGKRVNDLKMQIEAQKQAVKSAEAGVGVAALGGGAGGSAIGGPIEYLTGDTRHSGYRADHGGGNYHEHIAYKTAQEARAAAELLNRNGIKTTELKGVNPVGRHSSGSYHYSGQAFDVPAAQVPVGQEQALSARVRQILGIGGAGGAGSSGAVVGAQGNAATAKEELAGLQQQLQQLLATEQQFKALDMAAFIQQSTDAFKAQTDTLLKQNEALKLRTALEIEGVDPALIEAELQKLQVSQQLQERQEALKAAMEAGIITNQAYADSMNAIAVAAQGTAGAIDANAQAVVQQRDAADARQQAESDARGIASSLTGGLKDVIKAAITGGDVKAALSNMLAGLGERFLDIAMRPLEDMLTKSLTGLFNPQTTATTANTMALQQLTMTLQTASFAGGAGGFGGLGGLFGIASGGFGGGAFGAGFNPLSSGMLFPGGIFASGGSTPVNTPVLVGERGPELFVPGQSGGITNHQNLRSMMASGGSDQNGGNGAPVMNMSFETVQIMDQQWVDRPQLEAAMAAASKRGAADGERRALDKLKQSPSTRRSLGL